MTARLEYRIDTYEFSKNGKDAVHAIKLMHDWPVVYVLHRDPDTPKGKGLVYIGETLTMVNRFQQHLDNPAKSELQVAEVIVDATFNKSVCLDQESYLINLSCGDDGNRTVNRNDGQVNRNYYNRSFYQARFHEIFEDLHARGIFTKSRTEIENSEMFKYSPFKALNEDQLSVVNDVMIGLTDDLQHPVDGNQVAVVQGDPGTGKTIVATFLVKLLADLGSPMHGADDDNDSLFSDFFAAGIRELFRDLRTGLVVPMQDLIDAAGYDLSQIEPNIAAYYTTDSGLYSMPFNSSTPLLYYNKDMFEAAGITEIPTSLDEIAEVGDALLSDGGAQEVLAMSVYGWWFEQFLSKQGAAMVDNDNGRTAPATKVVFDENGAALNILEDWMDLNEGGWAPNVGRSGSDKIGRAHV